MSTSVLSIREQLAGLSPAKRALVELTLMKKRAAAGEPKQVITRRPSGASAPLSFYQQGLWVLSQLLPDTSLYHVPKGLRLTGELDVSALNEALNHLVSRHEALRTSFATSDGVPSQLVADLLTLDLPIIDLSHIAVSEREASAHRLLAADARRAFDLANGPLIRASLFRLQDTEHILLVTLHHIITDGWSMGIFERELSALYEAFAKGRPSPLPELSVQYPDYALWHREWFQGEAYESQLAYWKNVFKTQPPVLELPADHPRPAVQAHCVFRGVKRRLSLSRELTRKLKALCQKEESTLFMLLLAAYQTLLHRYTGEDDIVVGSPIAGRCLAETEQLIGLFINALALRVDLSGDPTFRELIGRVKEVALGAYAHQDLPFEMLVKEVQPGRSLAHNPLFQVMFVLQSDPTTVRQVGELQMSHVQVENIAANFDLTLDVVERDGKLECMFESNADLFDEDRITRLLDHFHNLLEGIAANPQQRLSQLPLLGETERHQLLVEWTNTATPYPANTSVAELFEEQVALAPHTIALSFGDRNLTYRELNERANQLAHYLKLHGVGPEARIGVCLERSSELIVSLLAILKAGGAYVPLDSSYPAARLAFMMEDAEVSLLLTQKSLRDHFNDSAARLICVEELELANELRTNPDCDVNGNNLAYVMYTSGSTGKPKGVAVTHKNIVRLVKNTNYANFTSDEVFLQFAPISFDASTFEIWGSLLNGARLALMQPGAASLDQLGAALKKHDVTTLWLTAGLFHLMVDTHLDDLKGLRQLLAGGDVLSVPHVKRVLQELPNCRLVNGYGPTENTTFTCCFPVTAPAVNGSVPIGRAISNTSVYVLDRHRNPAPIGIPGELYIGGDGLARGYLNRPELTAERFVRDPFGERDLLYRTGDLVRYRRDGELEFLGRIDGQVKVRGYRIELGEVETVLGEHDAVREAVVITRKDQGDKHLAAFVVLSDGASLALEDLRSFAAQKLPGHMIPSAITILDELPLSANGKVDRSALALIKTNTAERDPAARDAAATPSDQLEHKLLKIWERVLNVGAISVDDNFFDLGGHSLLAVRLFANIEKSFGRNLPLATLFQAPTVRQLASLMREAGWSAPWSSLVPLQNGGNRRPFFCIHAAGGNVLEYHDLARLVGRDQPFYGLQAQGLDGNKPPHTTIAEMAAHYLKEIRDVQPEGPYLIGGRSSGGTIAFEMACQLEAAGEQVALLALLDAYPAGYFKLLPGSGTFSQRMQRLLRKARMHRQNVQPLGGRAKLEYVTGKLKFAPAKIKHKIYRRAYKLYRRIGRPLPPVLRNIEELNFAAVKDYLPKIYPGCATIFLASDDLTAAYDVEEGWQDLIAGGLEKIRVPGNHLDIVKEPHVGVLARKLRACLDQASNDVGDVAGIA